MTPESYVPGDEAVLRGLCQLVGDSGAEVRTKTLGWRDWERVGELAVSHGLAPLLVAAVTDSTPAVLLPDSVRNELKAHYYRTAAHNALLFQHASNILVRLERAQAPAVVLKGVALAAGLYADPGLRPMGDIDLLVPRERLPAAMAALRAAEYEPETLGISDELTDMVAYEVNFDQDSGTCTPVRVELHWNLIGGRASRYRPRIEWFWEQTRTLPANILGDQVAARVLNPTANLLYLGAHLMLKHGGLRERLLWGYDIHELISKQGSEIDWNEVVERAAEFRWQAALESALLGVREAFGTPIPLGVLEELETLSDSRERDLVRQGVAAAGRWEKTQASMATLGWRARFRLALELVFPGKIFICRRYAPRPEWAWPIFYPWRWISVGAEAVRSMSAAVLRRLPTKGGRARDAN